MRSLCHALQKACVLHREKALGDRNIEKASEKEASKRHPEHECLVAQDHCECPVVEFQKDREKALFLFVCFSRLAAPFPSLCLEKDRTEHGRERQGHHSRDEDGHSQRDGKFPKEPSCHVPHEEQGDEHSNKGEGERDDRKANLACTRERSLYWPHALFQIAGDVFYDYYGVVHHKARGYDQGHEGQVVQGKVGKVHDAQGAHQGEGHGKRGDKGCPCVAQKDPDDCNDKDHSQHKFELHVRHCGAYGCRPVRDDLKLHRIWERGRKHGQARVDGVRNSYDVGSRLALHGNDDGLTYLLWCTVLVCLHNIGREQGVFSPFLDFCYVPQAYGSPVLVAYDGLYVLFRAFQLVVGVDGRGAQASVQAALGCVHIGSGYGRSYVLHGQIRPCQGLRVHPDPDGRSLAAGKGYHTHTRELRELLRHARVRQILKACHGQDVACESQCHDRRVCRVHLVVHRRRWQVRGQ